MASSDRLAPRDAHVSTSPVLSAHPFQRPPVPESGAARPPTVHDSSPPFPIQAPQSSQEISHGLPDKRKGPTGVAVCICVCTDDHHHPHQLDLDAATPSSAARLMARWEAALHISISSNGLSVLQTTKSSPRPLRKDPSPPFSGGIPWPTKGGASGPVPGLPITPSAANHMAPPALPQPARCDLHPCRPSQESPRFKLLAHPPCSQPPLCLRSRPGVRKPGVPPPCPTTAEPIPTTGAS